MFNMATTILVVIFMLVTRGEAKDDLENIVKEMNERLTLTEEKLKETQGELLELKNENVQLKDDLLNTKEDLLNTKEDLINTKEDLQTKDQELEMDVSFLKEPPFFHVCGFQQSTNILGETIPFSLLYSSTNTEGGDLDVDTGILISPLSGTYTVTWSLHSLDREEVTALNIILRKNGEQVGGSWHFSRYTGSTGYVSGMGRNITEY
jgi:hypothetical protein